MESIINDLQADYANVPISGLFLVYPQYYIHVLETSEDIIYKHLKALYDDKSEDCRFGKSIFLPFYHHVHQTLFTEWFHVYTVPPTLLDKLESYELTDIQKQVANCLEKVYTLCESITNTARDYSVSMTDVVRNLSDKISRMFPESTVLEYLLNAKHSVFLTVEDYIKIHATVPFIHLYQDSIWPPPRDFMFRGAFEADNRSNLGSTREAEAPPAMHGGHH
ncbi:uncharacterized protein LOC143367749 isoform X2 [Andrena cerasifolii]